MKTIMKLFILLSMYIIINTVNATELITYKANYGIDEAVWLELKDAPNNNQDWIGIYAKGSNTDWHNVIAWRWTSDEKSVTEVDPGVWFKFPDKDLPGKQDELALPQGSYVARFFLNNSYDIEASVDFNVGDVQTATLTTYKQVYNVNEDVWIQLENAQENDADWIGIYQEGSGTDRENAVAWRLANNETSTTEVDPGDWYKFPDNSLQDKEQEVSFPPGEYVARLFVNNNSSVESSVAFQVANNTPSPIEERVCDNTRREKNNKPCSVSTFNNISVYWSPTGGDTDKPVSVRYREADSTVPWENALKTEDLIYNPVTYEADGYKVPHDYDAVITVEKGELISKGDYRGSIVNLTPETTYEIELQFNNKIERIKASTWNESFNEVNISTDELRNLSHSKQFTISDIDGSAGEYVVIDGKMITNDDTKYTITGKTPYNILIKNSSYIILRNFTLKNAKNDAIRIEGDAENTHHIIIEYCDISHWGHEHKQSTYGHQQDSGIHAENNLSGSVFQYNTIHDPNVKANTWGQKNDAYKTNHPKGAQAITLKYNKKGNNVIRYNEFYASDNYFNDVIGGEKNDGAYGFLGPDSDIYGNYIANGYDDGIEVDGGGENVRVWNNFIEKTYLAIGNAPVTVGPLYIWRNISGDAEEIESPADEFKDKDGYTSYGSFMKMGSTKIDLNGENNVKSPLLMRGYIHIYNNTILNINEKGYGGIGTTLRVKTKKSTHRILRNAIIKNNILHVRHGVDPISKGGTKKDKKNENVTKANNLELVSPDRPFYAADTPTLNFEKTGNFTLISTNNNEEITGECINNIIPIPSPLLGAQAASELTMEFGTHYTFSPPENMTNCP